MTSNKPESPDHEKGFFRLNEEDNGHKLRCKKQCGFCVELEPSKPEPPANSPAPDKEEWKEEGVVYIGKWVKASDVLPAHGKILWLKDQGKFSGGYYNEETGMFCTDERDAAPIEEIEWMQELPLEQKLNEQAQTI